MKLPILVLTWLLLVVGPAVSSSVQDPLILDGIVTEAGTPRALPWVSISIVSVANSEISFQVEADSQGHFTVPVPRGMYLIKAKREGYFGIGPEAFCTSIASAEPVPQVDRISYSSDATACVAPQPLETSRSVSMALYPGGAIAGRILNPNGTLARGIAVRAAPLKDGKGLVARTDDRGEYRFWGLQPGEYIIGAGPNVIAARTSRLNSAVTYYPGYPGAVTLEVALSIAVASGSETSNINFVLNPTTDLTVSGRILSTLPLQPALYLISPQLFPLDAQRPVLVPNAIRPNGEFQFGVEQLGNYEILVLAESVGTRYSGHAALKIESIGTRELSIEIAPSVNVTGRLYTVNSAGEPKILSGYTRIRISALDVSPAASSLLRLPTIESFNGSFSIDSLPPGRYALTEATNLLRIVRTRFLNGQVSPNDVLEISGVESGTIEIMLEVK